ncbi:GTP-binding protein [Candidatus Woesearchaeota archaeon]|nr:MAG: GTP-binding protein [Candidatus Woesearchaeota archaeon]
MGSSSKNREKIKELEEQLKKTKVNKRTEGAVGLMKARLAALKEQEEKASSSKGGTTQGYSVRKSGDATVILLGFPSAGKSSLLNTLTGADSPVGAYEFTTLDVIPGLLEYKDAKIQILDVPGIVEGAASGRGRGREVLSVMHSADLVLVLLDVLRPNAFNVIMKEARDAHLRLNQRRPHVRITKKSKGGIDIGSTVKLTKIDEETIKKILKEFRILNADVVLYDDVDADEFIDAIQGNKLYLPMLVVVNKVDLASPDMIKDIEKTIKPDLFISAQKNINIDKLKELIFSKLKFIRIYTKEVGKPADMDEPLIMIEGATVEAVCNKLHKDFVKKFKYAKIWGPSAKFPGQRQMLKHVLKDGDIVEIHIH